jgi:hypothetical protein
MGRNQSEKSMDCERIAEGIDVYLFGILWRVQKVANIVETLKIINRIIKPPLISRNK